MQHVFSCKKGDFITLKFNHIRNVTAELLSQVTKNVKIEPALKSLTGEIFEQWTTNISDDARLHIIERRSWTKYQMAFFDIRVFDPNAKRHSAQMLQRCYISNEKEKKHQSNMKALQVENGSFTPLVFSINGGMDIIRKLRRAIPVNNALDPKELSFSLMRSLITCIRGSRTIESIEEKQCASEVASYIETRCVIQK